MRKRSPRLVSVRLGEVGAQACAVLLSNSWLTQGDSARAMFGYYLPAVATPSRASRGALLYTCWALRSCKCLVTGLPLAGRAAQSRPASAAGHSQVWWAQ